MATETETQKSEAQKTRRRWLTLGEIVGVLALTISAASLWDSHQERVESRARDAAAARAPKPVKAVAPLVLTASAEDEGRVLKFAANHDRVIQTQTVSFPAALGLDPIDTVGNPRIEASWFESALAKAVRDHKGRGRLPVAITTHYLDDGAPRTDQAIYDIGHGWRSRLLQSDAAVLEGMTLVARGDRDLQTRLDARWEKAHPAG